MTNLEKLKSLTVEQLAHINVKSQTYMCGYRPQTDFISSNGRIFHDREDAEEYEVEWLNSPEDKEVFVTLGGENECKEQ